MSTGSSQKMTCMSRAKRLMRCCGRWNTKFHRRCEKQIRVADLGSAAEGSAPNSTGTPTLVSIFRFTSVLWMTTDERTERQCSSPVLIEIKQISSLLQRNKRQVARLTRRTPSLRTCPTGGRLLGTTIEELEKRRELARLGGGA